MSKGQNSFRSHKGSVKSKGQKPLKGKEQRTVVITNNGIFEIQGPPEEAGFPALSGSQPGKSKQLIRKVNNLHQKYNSSRDKKSKLKLNKSADAFNTD